jgi:FkbM family methyltransferase
MNEWWLLQVLQAYKDKFPSREVAIDVGANVGEWAVLLSQHFARVYAIEPDPRASSKIPAADNIQVIEAAVCGEPGEVTLYSRPSAEQNSLLKVHPIGAGCQSDAPVIGELTVKGITLDESFPQGADFVKIDIEGAEVQALGVCSPDGRWSRTFFLVECHDTFGDIAPLLLALGKEVIHVQHPLQGVHPGHCWALGVPPEWK